MTQWPWQRNYPEAVAWQAPLRERTIGSFLDEAAASWPDEYSLDFLDRRITYGELVELVERAAAGFRALGVEPGVRVGLHLPNTPHYVIAFFAVLKCGGVVVNLSPLSATGELRALIVDAAPRIVVTLDLKRLYAVLAAALPETAVATVVVGSLAEVLPAGKGLLYRLLGGRHRARVAPDHMRFSDLLKARPPAVWPALEPDALAMLQYTGGTTGAPKGAMLSHGNIAAATQQSALWCGQIEMAKNDQVVGVLPLFHCYGLGLVLLCGMVFGAEVVLYPRLDLDRLMRDFARKRPAAFAGVPSLFAAVADHPAARKGALASLRLCLSGGAPLAPDLQARFENLAGCPVVEGYGLSETAAVACCTPFGAGRKPGSVGPPLPGTVVEIRDPDDPPRLLGPGEKGEVCIKGPQVMRGYWNQLEESMAAFVDGSLRTGDVGYLDDDGHLFLVDRIKDVILTGGFTVYPRIIEEAIQAHPHVRGGCVVGVADARRGGAPMAYVVLAPGAALSLDELEDFLAPRIGRHEMPVTLEIRAELPKTLVGKPSRAALRAEMVGNQ